MTMKRLGIFYSGELKTGGGPSGYLYNLREALINYPHQIDFIFPKEKRYSFRLLILRKWLLVFLLGLYGIEWDGV